MNYPLKKNHSRLLALIAATLLLIGMLAGCQREDSDDDHSQSTPGPNLNLVDDENDPTESEPTENSEPINENMATVIGTQVNLRSSPSTTANVITTLEAGTQVEIILLETTLGVEWARVKVGTDQGWISTEFLEMNFVPETTDPVDTPPEDETTPTEPDETQPEEQDPVEENDGTATMGVVIAGELNIRDEASTNGDRVGSYTYGDRVSLLETKNGWGRTNKGWISLNYVYVDGTTGTNTGKGVVTGSELNVRSGPGTNYDIVGSVKFGDRVTILEQIEIKNTKWACTKDGWISLDYVYVDGTTGENSGTGTVTGEGLNIRTGPGTNYGIDGSYNKGDTVKILTQIKIDDMTWGCTEKGWISMKYVDMDD